MTFATMCVQISSGYHFALDKGFAECRTRKGYMTKNSSAKTSLPSVFLSGTRQSLAECHDSTQQKKVVVTAHIMLMGSAKKFF
jgi:hypothetical protein